MSLAAAARKVIDNAYAPYSGFKVAAAIRTDRGEIFCGVNVENVAYPEGTCAEAGAIAAMVAAGHTKIAAAYVLADSATPVPPCGGCRQKLAEFAAPDMVVTMATLTGHEQSATIGELLPAAFAATHLDEPESR